MANKEPQYHLTIFMSGDRRNKQAFHTLKSARHYAKQACNNENVERITLTGVDVEATVLYDVRAPKAV